MREALSGGGMSVTEAAGADQPIGRLPTSTTGFVGRALRGPVPRHGVRSFAEYQQIFGGLWQPSTLAYAVEQYFDSGGREAVVVRVINGGAPATISLPCGKRNLQLEAVSPGSRETLRASIDYDNIGSNEDDRFNLVLQRVRTLGSEHIEDQEIFRRFRSNRGRRVSSCAHCRSRCSYACAASSRPRGPTVLFALVPATRLVTWIRIPTATTACR